MYINSEVPPLTFGTNPAKAKSKSSANPSPARVLEPVSIQSIKNYAK